MTARVIDRLSYNIVQTTSEPSRAENPPARIDGEQYAWRRIITPSGKTGWIPEKYARSPVGLRMVFQKIDGDWKVMSIAIGD